MTGHSPQSVKEAIEILTGIFEGGSYCTLADNPRDTAGGLSYGKHQASELQGSLTQLLKQYVQRTSDPLPSPEYVTELQVHLRLYNAVGNRYQGSPAQRAAYKKILQTACGDPAMQRTQDEFFDERYFDPAMQHAVNLGVFSPLGQSIFYDIAIQAGSARLSFYKSALARWIEQAGSGCSACAPKDSAGPDEKTFLRYVNNARRNEMLASSSPAYRASVYRPNEYDKLLDAGNLDFKQDFIFRGVPIKALP